MGKYSKMLPFGCSMAHAPPKAVVSVTKRHVLILCCQLKTLRAKRPCGQHVSYLYAWKLTAPKRSARTPARGSPVDLRPAGTFQRIRGQEGRSSAQERMQAKPWESGRVKMLCSQIVEAKERKP